MEDSPELALFLLCARRNHQFGLELHYLVSYISLDEKHKENVHKVHPIL